MKNTESQPTGTNVEEIDNKNLNYELIEKTDISKTPFELVTIRREEQEEKSFIAWGKFRLTEETNKEELIERIGKLQNTDWDMVMILSTCIGMNINNQI